MANLKEVRGRINSVKSTQQITKAMKMVAAAKLRKAQDNIMQMRPYAEKLNQILGNVSATLESASDNQYGQQRDQVKSVLLILVTSDRGLCGAFNSNIVKAARQRMATTYADQEAAGKVDLLCIGKKAADIFKREREIISDWTESLLNLTFDEVKGAAEFAMQKFVDGTYDRVEIIYNEFKNVATQVIQTEAFLPIEEKEEEVQAVGAGIDYIFEPSKQFIVKELIPKSLKIQLYKAVLDSVASEHGARMTAMDKATDNAGELLKELKLTYNRTRQAAITTEILEIVGGAEALSQGA